jgi:hypothetical protein
VRNALAEMAVMKPGGRIMDPALVSVLGAPKSRAVFIGTAYNIYPAAPDLLLTQGDRTGT